VIALSPTDAWAVGFDCVARCGNTGPPIYHTLILHWNGTAWSQVPSPNPGTTPNELTSVSAASATDIWAAGSYGGLHQGPLTLTLHWNGTAWSQVPSPNPGTQSNGQLNGVSAASPTSVLAVGSYCASACGLQAAQEATLGMHWDGTAWALTPTPSPHQARPELAGVSALSAANAWAVGSYAITTQTLIAHWNGTAWSRVPSPNPSGSYNVLSGVYARTATDGWAVGSCGVGTGSVLILHWNGRAWSLVAC
jgi:hypothetical protein